MHNKNPKGSEWQKWDLHVHTPCSVLNNEFGSDWDIYVKKLFKKAIQEKIHAIGITDYFTIEGYKTLKQNYLTKEDKLQELFDESEIEYIKNILIIPNIEFRLSKLILAQKSKDVQADSRINFHLILSDQIEIYQIEELLNSLEFEVLSNNSEIEKHPLNIRNLTSLGSKLRAQHLDFKDYSDVFIGMMNASISEDDLIRILKTRGSIFAGKYLIGLPADEDLSSVNWNSQGHLARKNLLKKSSLIFSSNFNTINFGLGKRHASVKDFINEFGNLKPCVWGSDAHSYEKLFEPDLHRLTWIKAANTFEGLKQILHEPEARVIIGQDAPDSKAYYQVIDKVRFIDNTGHKLFQPSWIEINDSLTVIIGGKSSGKSLLLFHIAAAIDSNQVSEKNYFNENGYDNLKDKIDFEVKWKNGTSDLLSATQKNGRLTYIPQLYINHLVEREGKGRLQELILEILLQNEELKEFFDNANIKKNSAKQKISTCINNIFALRDKYKEMSEGIKRIGTNEQIRIEIERLNKVIDALKAQSNFTEEQYEKYNELSNKQNQNNINIANQDLMKVDLKRYISEVAEKNKITLNAIQLAAKKVENSPIFFKVT